MANRYHAKISFRNTSYLTECQERFDDVDRGVADTVCTLGGKLIETTVSLSAEFEALDDLMAKAIYTQIFKGFIGDMETSPDTPGLQIHKVLTKYGNSDNILKRGNNK